MRPAIRRSSAAMQQPRCTMPYDPAKARQLLADAGYPNGFDTELVTYELPQWAATVQGYLKVVGIKAKLSILQTDALVQRSMAGQNPLELGSWGSYSINDVSAILPSFFAFGPAPTIRVIQNSRSWWMRAAQRWIPTRGARHTTGRSS